MINDNVLMDIDRLIDRYGNMVTRICIMNLRNIDDAKRHDYHQHQLYPQS